MKCPNFPPAAGFASNRAKIQFLKFQNLLVSRGASIRVGAVVCFQYYYRDAKGLKLIMLIILTMFCSISILLILELVVRPFLRRKR